MPGLGLNDGAIDGNGSNSRILNQLVPTGPILDPSLPSIAEALALMAGSLLLTSVKDAPFTQFFVSTASSTCQQISWLIRTELYSTFKHHQ